ncbi:hypothetical protein LP419_22675 [Massilia sp. H-1]|nr:hypothetical protein LP419_22675 [Massilia sp. H-1]
MLTFENIWKAMRGMGEADPARTGARRARAAAVRRGDRCPACLGREWITGKALSLADLALAPSMMYIERGRLPLARFLHLMAWFARIQALLRHVAEQHASTLVSGRVTVSGKKFRPMCVIAQKQKRPGTIVELSLSGHP